MSIVSPSTPYSSTVRVCSPVASARERAKWQATSGGVGGSARGEGSRRAVAQNGADSTCDGRRRECRTLAATNGLHRPPSARRPHVSNRPASPPTSVPGDIHPIRQHLPNSPVSFLPTPFSATLPPVPLPPARAPWKSRSLGSSDTLRTASPPAAPRPSRTRSCRSPRPAVASQQARWRARYRHLRTRPRRPPSGTA